MKTPLLRLSKAVFGRKGRIARIAATRTLSAFARWTAQTTRRGLHNCNECRKPFTVRMGTIFEVVAPAAASVAANHPFDVRQQEGHFDPAGSTHARLQHENRLVSYPSHSRSDEATVRLAPMGGEGGIVEIDETFIGSKEGFEKRGAAISTRMRFFRLSSVAALRDPSMSTAPKRRMSCRSSRRTSRAEAT